MNSLILQATTRFMLPVLILFSVFLLFRGHNSPGGGFAGGLVAAAAFILYAIAFGPEAARQSLRVEPRAFIGGGLLVALVGVLLPGCVGQPWQTGLWLHVPWTDPEGLHVGTPVIFDIGVYLAVAGVALTIILTLAEED
jgi:multicomponent Na+:H+ antiporter subunit B